MQLTAKKKQKREPADGDRPCSTPDCGRPVKSYGAVGGQCELCWLESHPRECSPTKRKSWRASANGDADEKTGHFGGDRAGWDD